MVGQKKRRIKVIWEGTNDVMAWLAAATIVAVMLLVTMDTIKRYIFATPSVWISDLISEFLIIYITMLPVAWILWHGGHVRVEVIESSLRPKPRYILGIVSDILCLLYAAVLAWQGWLLAWRHMVTGTVFPSASALPKFPVMTVIFIGAVFLAIQIMVRLVSKFRPSRDDPAPWDHLT